MKSSNVDQKLCSIIKKDIAAAICGHWRFLAIHPGHIHLTHGVRGLWLMNCLRSLVTLVSLCTSPTTISPTHSAVLHERMGIR